MTNRFRPHPRPLSQRARGEEEPATLSGAGEGRKDKESAVKLIQVLGAGCPTCEKLKRNAETAVRELGIEATVEKVSDINVITSLGAMMIPALAIDGEVKVVGKVPSPDEIKKLLA